MKSALFQKSSSRSRLCPNNSLFGGGDDHDEDDDHLREVVAAQPLLHEHCDCDDVIREDPLKAPSCPPPPPVDHHVREETLTDIAQVYRLYLDREDEDNDDYHDRRRGNNDVLLTMDHHYQRMPDDVDHRSSSSSSSWFAFMGAVANLCSATLGAGVLALPLAVYRAGLVGGFVMLLVSAGATVISIYLLAAASEVFGQSTYEGLVHAVFGSRAALSLRICIIIFCVGTAVAYVICLGDILEMSGLLLPLPTAGFGLRRTGSMFVVWILAMLPLSCLRRMQNLQFSSAVGIAAIGTLVFAATVHYVDDEKNNGQIQPYNNETAPDNTTLGTMILNEQRGNNYNNDTTAFESSSSSLWDYPWPSSGGVRSLIQACPIFIFAFSSQVNVHAIYHELPSSSSGIGSKLAYMTKITVAANGICVFLYAAVSCVALADFGSTVTPNILSRYAPPAAVMQTAAACMALTVVTAFPLNIFPSRVTLHQILFAEEEENDNDSNEEDEEGATTGISRERQQQDDEELHTLTTTTTTTTSTTTLTTTSGEVASSGEPLQQKQPDDTASNADAADEHQNNHHNNDSIETSYYTSLMGNTAASVTSEDDDNDDDNLNRRDCQRHYGLTFALAATAFALACIVPDISVVFGLLGGTTSALLGFVLPGALGIRMHQHQRRRQQLQQQQQQGQQRQQEQEQMEQEQDKMELVSSSNDIRTVNDDDGEERENHLQKIVPIPDCEGGHAASGANDGNTFLITNAMLAASWALVVGGIVVAILTTAITVHGTFAAGDG